MKADCHCHTIFSDGVLTPVAILDLAKEKNLFGLSITDHDTIGAYPEAIPYAQQLGIELISGIEISAEHLKSSVHVLGYAFDLNNAKLNAFCQQQQLDRTARNQTILEKLDKIKLFVSMEELKIRFPQSTIGRPHIAQMLVEKGYVKSAKKAFERYLGNKGRCYVRGVQVSVEKAIELIRHAGGFAVLAHPHAVTPQRNLPSLLELSFDGIEAYYGHAHIDKVTPLLEMARKKSIFVTGGSDYHGGIKSFHSLGCAFTPLETFELFRARFNQHTAI